MLKGLIQGRFLVVQVILAEGQAFQGALKGAQLSNHHTGIADTELPEFGMIRRAGVLLVRPSETNRVRKDEWQARTICSRSWKLRFRP
ncbi:hypothetical protein [Breoghania sp.]|uniref:hypothetical protein n=1 Tax=Breoghania sp. TaxID=2065378 RepID=UPI0026178E6C|nr:hypothetical protein [Breoghania sp.]MDJ0933449.1 hypothetical protein [Breoghania sp.]